LDLDEIWPASSGYTLLQGKIDIYQRGIRILNSTRKGKFGLISR
jgi:hypothetical protein